MALIKSITLSVYGKDLVFDNAYHEVKSITGDKQSVDFLVFVYDNINKNNIIQQKNYTFSPNVVDSAPNFYKQAYEYLKTTDEYKGATDVLEDGQTA